MLHGSFSYLLQDAWGQVAEAHSVSAGLDYPGVGPEHAFLKDSGRATYASATDDEALAAFRTLSRARGHHPGARERPRDRLRAAAQRGGPARRGADEAPAAEPPFAPDDLILVCLSGRGDKDIYHAGRLLGVIE